ncbi:MAG: tetratricopeptide repeat protein [Verrucomicrobiales bacterium]|nr:tetratricopeptide repeat protein [Verrucomicrobiales bacterium]
MVLSCINTSYSRKHEKQITSDLPRLISGQFATHGDAFYEQQLVWTTRLIELQPDDFSARIDRSAALLKLQRYTEAESLLLQIEKDTPGQYKTHANLGVLYKKMGEIDKAVQHTKRALEIQPEGHLGLGDYYLQMLKWKKENPFPEAATENFLGVKYEAGTKATANSPLANEEWLKTLIISDRHFHDVYWVLGDVLFEKGDLQNAMRSYQRAGAHLEHSASDPEMPRTEKVGHTLLSQRIDLVQKAFWERAEGSADLVFDVNYYTQIESEISTANKWLSSFQKSEAELIADGMSPDFDEVNARMKEKRISEPTYLDLGVFEGKEVEENGTAHIAGTILAAAVALMGLIILSVAGYGLVRFYRSRLVA